MEQIHVVQVGLGPIGRKVVQFMAQRPSLKIVGAVDPAPAIAGKDLGELCEVDSCHGIVVAPDIAQVAGHSQAKVAVLTTVSGFEEGAEQAVALARRGLHVVSTCEEMVYPWSTAPDIAGRLDTVAKEQGVAVLGTGVNPGFLMDALPITLTAVCRDVQRIKVERFQDASSRRIPFQQKIGAALTPDQFEAKKKTGTLRHVGLTESIHMIAARLGWQLEKTEDVLSPVIAEAPIISGYKPIEPGMAAGVRQIGRGYRQGEEVVTLEFVAAVGQDNPHDTIEIIGTPGLRSTIEGGINGDIATCAITVNAIANVVGAQPGLRTMADIAPVSFYSTLNVL